MSVHTSTMTPTAIPARLERTSHARPLPAAPLSAAPRPTTPRANANAPTRMTSASRLMSGHTMIAMPRATERAPLRPSDHRTRVNARSVNCSACSSTVLIATSDRSLTLVSLAPRLRCGIGESAEALREPRTSQAGSGSGSTERIVLAALDNTLAVDGEDHLRDARDEQIRGDEGEQHERAVAGLHEHDDADHH